jgi:hypothetical protein
MRGTISDAFVVSEPPGHVRSGQVWSGDAAVFRFAQEQRCRVRGVPARRRQRLHKRDGTDASAVLFDKR